MDAHNSLQNRLQAILPPKTWGLIGEKSTHIGVRGQNDWRGLIVPSLPFPIYRKFRICGTDGLAARPKCGCELSPRPYFSQQTGSSKAGQLKRKQPRDVDLEAA